MSHKSICLFPHFDDTHGKDELGGGVDSKAFLILNEIILTLKDGNDEARKQAYNVLLDIGSTLRDLSYDGPTAPYHKLINMIMGYLSGSSPHIQSGAVSALIKAVLGFVKVMVSCLQAKDLHNFLSDIVTVIFDIIIRKCGAAAVKAVTPEKHTGFIKTELENRHGRSNAGEAVNNDTEIMPEGSSAKGPEQRKKPKNLDSQENGAGKLKKRKREKKSETHLPSLKDPLKSCSNQESDSAKRARHSYNNNSKKGGQEGSKKGNWSSNNKGLTGGGMRKIKPKRAKKRQLLMDL